MRFGLSNRNPTSYRNRFVAGVGHYGFSDWLAMTDAGLAKRFSTALYGGQEISDSIQNWDAC